MNSNPVGRRGLLQFAAVMLGVSAAATKASAAPCATLDGSDASLRKSLHYVEASPDAAKSCGKCSFFTAPEGACGKCMIFNGPANPAGRCDSFAPKG